MRTGWFSQSGTGQDRASTPTPVLVTQRWSTHPSGQAHGQGERRHTSVG